MRLICCLLFCLPLYLSGQIPLLFTENDDFEYIMRISESGNTLIQSDHPALLPWLGPDQFGWLITDKGKLDSFFEAINKTEFQVDFTRQFVLALIRFDPYPWHMSIKGIHFDPLHAHIQVQYYLEPSGKKRKDPILSCLLVRVDKNKELRNLGVQNLQFTIKEFRGFDDAEIPVAGQNPRQMIFPAAYTWTELYPKAEQILYMDSTASVSVPIDSLSKIALKSIQETEQIMDPFPIVPMFIEPDHYRVRPDLNLTGTEYRIVQDLLAWDNILYSPGPDTLVDERFFERYDAIVVLKKTETGKNIVRESLTFVDSGIRIQYSIQSSLPADDGNPYISYILLVEKHRHLLVDFWENGHQAQTIYLIHPDQ